MLIERKPFLKAKKYMYLGKFSQILTLVCGKFILFYVFYFYIEDI